MFVCTSVFSSPFTGEGKKAYIQRCISTINMPNATEQRKKIFCFCFANKYEVGYKKWSNSIKSTDTFSMSQKKLVDFGKKAAKECM